MVNIGCPKFLFKKNKMKTLFLNTIVLLFSLQGIYAQEDESVGSEQNSSSSTSLISSKLRTLYIVSNMNPKKEQASLDQLLNNGVQIQQIGSFNTFYADIKSNESKVSVVQNGVDNKAYLSKNVKSVVQNVLQEGQHNTIDDFSLYSNYDVNMELIQQGDNQNIHNYGTNSISKNMKVIQSGNGASVILINNKKQ